MTGLSQDVGKSQKATLVIVIVLPLSPSAQMVMQEKQTAQKWGDLVSHGLSAETKTILLIIDLLRPQTESSSKLGRELWDFFLLI